MNNDRNSNESNNVFDQLRAANPHVDEGNTPTTQTSQDARFKEITMQPHDTATTNRNPATAQRWWRSPLVAAPSALAVVAILAVGALVFGTLRAPSAQATVIAAAENVADADSGRIEVIIELREVPDEEMGTIVFDYRFNNEDYSILVEMSGVESADGSTQPDDELFGDRIEFRRVDGSTYSPAFGGEPGQFIKIPDEDDEIDLADLAFGIDADSLGTSSIVPILVEAENFQKADSADGVTTYTGTIASSVVLELPASDLPPGLSLLAESDGTDLPENLDITAVIRNDQLETLTVLAKGDTDDGFLDVEVTTRVTEVGQDQNIVAPADDQIVDMSEVEDLFGLPEGIEDTFAVIEELEERRPGLCEEVFGDLEELDPTEFGAEAFEAANEAFMTCLEAEGESEAAAAFAELMDFEFTE